MPPALDEVGKACVLPGHPCPSGLVCRQGVCARDTAPGGVLLPAGATWRYTTGSVSAGWAQLGYADDGWAQGTAPLGYGMAGLATEVCCADAGLTTAYFRHGFELSAPTLGRLVLGVRRDDGAVAYLNGLEVFRTNMPTGLVNSSTPAAGHSSGADEMTLFEVTLDGGVVREGANLAAVEVHQDRPASSDMVFDLQLVEEAR